MEPTQQTQDTTPNPPVKTSSTGLFGTRIPASAAFLVAILLFLLPFAELRCNGAAVAYNTGLRIAIGNDWKEAVTKNLFGNSFDNNLGNTSSNDDQMHKQDPNKFAIAALGLGIIALLIAFFCSERGREC